MCVGKYYYPSQLEWWMSHQQQVVPYHYHHSHPWTLYGWCYQLSCEYTHIQLKTLRTELFNSAKTAGLVHPKDDLVRCLKRAVGPPLVVKYATDIAELCYALKHHRPVPRTLLKNGKRSATTFIASRLHFHRISLRRCSFSYKFESNSTAQSSRIWWALFSTKRRYQYDWCISLFRHWCCYYCFDERSEFSETWYHSAKIRNAESAV